MRLFLRALRWEHPELRPGVPEGLLGRYLKEEDEATHYEDARTGEGRRSFRSVPGPDLDDIGDRWESRYPDGEHPEDFSKRFLNSSTRCGTNSETKTEIAAIRCRSWTSVRGPTSSRRTW